MFNSVLFNFFNPMIKELFNKYGWYIYSNICYNDEIILKYRGSSISKNKPSDWFIYISGCDVKYYISIPLKSVNSNMVMSYNKNDETIYYKIYKDIEDKIIYLENDTNN